MFVFRLERHAAGEAKILQDVAEFWDDVANRREPEATPALDADLFRLLHPTSNPMVTVDLTGDNYLPTALIERAAAKARMAADHALIEEIDTELKFKMGSAELALLNGFSATLKEQTRKAYSVAETTFRVLRVRDHRAKQEIESGKPIKF